MGVLGCAFLAWGVIPFHLFDHSTNMDATELTRNLLNTTQPEATATFAVAIVVDNGNDSKVAGAQRGAVV